MDRPIANAVAYLRVSRGEQELGPEAQRAAILRFAQRERIEIVKWHDDTGKSGARSGWLLPIHKRPGLVRAIDDIRAGVAQLLLVDNRDRLGRKLPELLWIEAAVFSSGGWILSACGTGNERNDMSTLVRHIHYLFADAESRRKSARINGVFGVKRDRGEVTGNPPFGLGVGPDRKLVANGEELQTLFAIASLRRRGFSIASVQRELRRWGLFCRRGTPMSAWALRRICDRLRLVANASPEGPFPFYHSELQRPMVWQLYKRALREGQRIHPARSRQSQPVRPELSAAFKPLKRRAAAQQHLY